MAKEFHIGNPLTKIADQTAKFSFNSHREINLVPDVKNEMIKALKLRNLIFFLCIVVAAASVGVTIFFGTIAGGQQIAISSKKDAIAKLSEKLKSYSDLNEFLTIKDQLSNIADVTADKKVLSRTFNTVSAMLPTGADYIRISELNIDLSEGGIPVYSFEAQANAGRPPYIDYNVLDSFKKSMKYLRYDFGQYVDKYGATIPAYCIVEKDANGAVLSDPISKDLYAYWNITGEGCNPSASPDDEEGYDLEILLDHENLSELETGEESITIDGYDTEDYGGVPMVRIWRTPQFTEWYKKDPKDNEPNITLDGAISNVPHFESACITYTGIIEQNNRAPKWTTTNDSCLLVPSGEDGIDISESSNGRDASNELVLRFTANIVLAPEIYDFNNTHLLALPPSGRYNVTDSYRQIQEMFGERARDCAKDDAACKGGN